MENRMQHDMEAEVHGNTDGLGPRVKVLGCRVEVLGFEFKTWGVRSRSRSCIKVAWQLKQFKVAICLAVRRGQIPVHDNEFLKQSLHCP